jgi:hypothetical protein
MVIGLSFTLHNFNGCDLPQNGGFALDGVGVKVGHLVPKVGKLVAFKLRLSVSAEEVHPAFVFASCLDGGKSDFKSAEVAVTHSGVSVNGKRNDVLCLRGHVG